MALAGAHRVNVSGSRCLHQQQAQLVPRVTSHGFGTLGRRTLPIVAVTDLTEAQWETEVLQSDKPVLVDFWAPWCGPCKLVAPLMTWAEKEFPDIKVVKVEHDLNKGLVEQYKVYGLPTFIVFKDGKEVAGSKTEGAMNKVKLTDYIKKHAAAKVAA